MSTSFYSSMSGGAGTTVVVKDSFPLSSSHAHMTGCRQSAQCKLQLSLLHCVGRLSSSLSLPSLSFESGAVGVALYLHDDQSAVLQEAARGMVEKLVKVNADVVWLVLAQLSPSSVAQETTSPLLTPYQFLAHENDRKYSKNVQKLLPLTLLP